MKKSLGILSIFLFPFFTLLSLESFAKLSQEAEALWKARDFERALLLYDSLLNESLSPWQYARLQYNVGTLYLSKTQPLQALNTFKSIQVEQLSLPLFGRNLLFNSAMAYLTFGKLDSTPSLERTVDEKILWTQLGMHLLLQIAQWECTLEKREEGDASSCFTSALVEEGNRQARKGLFLLHRQKRERELQDATSQVLVKALYASLQRFSEKINRIGETFESLTPPVFRALSQAGEEFIPEWKALEKKMTSSHEVTLIQKGHLSFLKSLEALQHQHLAPAQHELEAAMKALLSVTPQEMEETALTLLQFSFLQATHALQTFFIFYQQRDQKEYEALIQTQDAVFAFADRFIPAVMKEETTQFRFSKDHACQIQPWDRVMPLFDQGYTAAKEVQKELGVSPIPVERILGLQEKTLNSWHEAIQLLLHPPQEHPNAETPTRQNASLQETMRLIQEMYLEDQSSRQPVKQEFHTW